MQELLRSSKLAKTKTHRIYRLNLIFQSQSARPYRNQSSSYLGFELSSPRGSCLEMPGNFTRFSTSLCVVFRYCVRARVCVCVCGNLLVHVCMCSVEVLVHVYMSIC